MSIRVMSWVWEHSDAEGVELLIELALADFANDEGRSFPSIDSIARKARASHRYVMITLRNLEAAGRLKVEYNAGPRTTNVYTLTMQEGGHSVPPGALGDIKGGQNGALKMPPGGQNGALKMPPIHQDPSEDPSGSVSDPSFFSEQKNSRENRKAKGNGTNASEPRTPDRREPPTPGHSAALADRLRPDDQRGAREHIPRRYREL